MKIIHMVCDQLPPGGVQYSVHNLCNGLADRGHEVVLMARKSLFELPPGIYDLEEARYKVQRYFLPPSKGHFHAQFGRHAFKKFYKEFPADIIHCSMGWPCPLWLLDAFPKPLRGLIAMFHGADIQIFPELNYGFRLDPRRDREIGRIIRECPNLLAISTEMKRQLMELGASENKIAVVPNGVDVSLYAGDAPKRLFDKPYVFAMGRLISLKSYDVLIRSFAEASKNTDVNLCIAGKGPEEENLRALISELGLSERVHLVGYVEGDEKFAWLRHAMCFAHPSKREAFGIVNAEAQAAGLPVIAFAVDGHLDIIEDGVNGFLVPPYNEEKMADALRAIITDETKRKSMGEKALENSRRFDWKEVVLQVEKYYESIV